MPVARLRSGAIALIITLLCVFVAVPDPPVAAAPSPAPTVSTSSQVGFEIGKAPSAKKYNQPYYYWSVSFLKGMIKGNDPRLMDDRALNRLGPHEDFQVGQVEHLLTAWLDSDAREDLKAELDKLRKDYEDKAERLIRGDGSALDEEKEQIRVEFRAKYEKEAASKIATRWNKYVKSYVTIMDSRMRGKAFELVLARLLGISVTDPQWKYDQYLPKAPGMQKNRRGDLWSDLLMRLNEFKSGAEISQSQLDDLLIAAAALDIGQLDIFFGVTPKKKTRERIERKLREIEEENKDRAARGKKLEPTIQARQVPLLPIPVEIWKMPAGQTFSTMPEPPASLVPATAPAATGPPDDGQPAESKPTGPTGPDSGPSGTLNAGGQTPAEGTSDDLLADSPESPEDVELVTEVAEQEARALGYASADEAGMLPEQLGGVDFSTLELRYIADTYDGGVGTGVEYAYQVDPDEGAEVSYGGRQAAQLAADSFFTWLALPPRSFTVNLNPDEPNRIIDAELGKTDAGRVLLEADLQMKKTVAKLIHPDTARGRVFWSNLRGETRCISMRQWIVPKPAVVREDGNRLFILDAPLEVKMETEYFQATGAASSADCATQADSDTRYNEQVYRERILPLLEKAVNEDPEYADLRRVYASRVAAEWYRQRSDTKTTAYGDLIDSGDVSAWSARTAWSPREVFDRYVKSYKNGEFRVERRTRRGNTIYTNLYVYGGVDLTRIPKRLLSAAELTSTRPALAAAVDESLYTPAAEEDGATWLGGRTTERPLYAPTPPPTSPLGRPYFYLTALPVLAWLFVGGYLLLRWRRRTTGAAA